MVLFSPWGSSATGSLQGEGLPYGIPSGGTFVIWYGIPSGGKFFRVEEFPCDTGVLLGVLLCVLLGVLLGVLLDVLLGVFRDRTHPLLMHDNVYFIHRYRWNK